MPAARVNAAAASRSVAAVGLSPTPTATSVAPSPFGTHERRADIAGEAVRLECRPIQTELARYGTGWPDGETDRIGGAGHGTDSSNSDGMT